MTTAAANRYSGTGCCWKERKESKAFWADVFQDMDGWMVSRGLKKVQVFFFVVTDDFPGVREIISSGCTPSPTTSCCASCTCSAT